MIDISGAGTLTLGTSGIDLSAATSTNLTINSGLTVQGQQSWKAAAAKTLNVAGPFTRTGAYIDFSSFNATAVLGTLGNTYNILGSWAYSGSAATLKYVTSASSLISAYTAATPDAGNLASVTSATDNYKYSAAATLGANRTGNTLQYTGATATTTALGANSLTLNGLMNAGTGDLTISGNAGSLGLVTGASGELDIISNNRNINISAVISGTGALVYGGPSAGTLTLNAPTNTYSGGTIINAGTLSFAAYSYNPNPILGTGPVTVNGPGTLALNRDYLTNSITLNSGTVTSGNSFGSTLSGPISLTGTATLSITGGFQITGDISGSGGLTKSGGSVVPLTGLNTYTGVTTITAGA
jgi:autotransporter-associated beta strand protein